MNTLFANLPNTIFDTMSGLARDLGAINLGQGFPEWDGPLDIREAAARAIIEHSNQYPPMRGLPQLREAVADHYAEHQGVRLDWRTEVTITSGATEAIAAAILASVNPGDEVVLIEPWYDAYPPLVERAGASIRYVRLQPPHWRLTREMLAAAFTPKTKAIILNTPVNPAAAMFSAEELAVVAEFCVKHDAIAISDEVWEHLSFDDRRHVSVLSVPGLRERSIKIGSAGKMFSMTGWKVGLVCAAPKLTEAVARAHQFLTFTTPPGMQAGVAYGLAKPMQYFDAMRADFQRRRDRMMAALRAEGFKVLQPEGTYFLAVDLAASGVEVSDMEFALRAVKEAGVASIPFSAFYASPPETSLLRLCFAKHDETIDQGVERLAKARRLFA